jgi:hypothetical protein
LENVMGMVKKRRLSAPSTGQWAGSVAWAIGRDTSNSSPQTVQRKSYSAMTYTPRVAS